MECIVVELAGVWAVIEVEPPRILATCQHREYATSVVAALHEWGGHIELGEGADAEPDKIIGVESVIDQVYKCARCGLLSDDPIHTDAGRWLIAYRTTWHEPERPSGDAPKLPR